VSPPNGEWGMVLKEGCVLLPELFSIFELRLVRFSDFSVLFFTVQLPVLHDVTMARIEGAMVASLYPNISAN